MNVTDHTRATITQALRNKSMSQTFLAEKMGLGKAWVSKLLNGGIKRLSDEHTDALEDILDISFFTLVDSTKIPGIAVKLGKLMEERPEVAEIANSLLAMDESLFYSLPHLPTRDLVDFGKEILRASHEDPDKPGKVGKIALNRLSKRLDKLKGGSNSNRPANEPRFSLSDFRHRLKTRSRSDRNAGEL